MKAKLEIALKANVDPLWFALTCAALFSVSMTATALAQDVLSAIDNPAGTEMMMTTEGQIVWHAQ